MFSEADVFLNNFLLNQPYNEKWLVDSPTGHIKLFADPNKCITSIIAESVYFVETKLHVTNITNKWLNE